MTVLNLSDAVAPSRANGPGLRAVLWVQGCNIHCEGCHNPQTWAHVPRVICTAEEVVRWYSRVGGLRGITFSGGEPFEQAYGLAAIARELRSQGADVVTFTGHRREELERDSLPSSSDLLRATDLLIDGPFVRSSACREPLRASSNQRLHFLTDRITPEEVQQIPRGELVAGTGVSRLIGLDLPSLQRIAPTR